MDTPTCDETVVVGDDGTWRSRSAVHVAAEEARRRGLPLTVLTVSEPDSHREARLPVPRWTRPHVVRQLDHRQHVTSGTHAAPPGVPVHDLGVPVHDLVLVDPSDDDLARCLTGAALLVVGAHGGHGRRAFGLGSTSGRLLHASSCPLLVVPEEGPARSSGQPERVVAGVDDGPSDTLVLRAAAAEAGRRGASLQVVHAYARRAGESGEVALSVARAVVERQLELAALDPGLRVTKVLTPEPAASALVHQAASAALLVIGPRAPIALVGLVTGSVSRQVLDVVPCPVLLVTPGHPRQTSAVGTFDPPRGVIRP